ncbi:hypothetical protein [Streptomyces sp. NPDC093568]|uniref:hypothetical protein n=1 Tax=Streptomyces sp. NPDC093568 TaxID=3366041 RepID=UPI00381B0EC3
MSDTTGTENIHATDADADDVSTQNIHATSEPLKGKNPLKADEETEVGTDNIHATDEPV